MPVRLEPGYACWFPLPAIGSRAAVLIDPRRAHDGYRTALHAQVAQPVVFAVSDDRRIDFRGEHVDVDALVAAQKRVTR